MSDTDEAGDGPVAEALHLGGLAQADLRLVPGPSGPLVMKDYSDRPAWLRLTWGRWLCAREQAAYRTIEERLGRPGFVPRFEGPVGKDAFLLAYRPGRPLSRSLAGELPAGFVEELEAAVAALHAAGIVHLDLSHRSNVLLDAAGHPVLLDFASAVCAPRGGVRHRLLLALVGWVDRRALRKWRRKLGQGGAASA